MSLPYTLLMPKESFIYSLDDTDAAARPFLQYARDYVAHLGVERGSSRLTLAAYESDLRDYFAFLLGRGVLAPCDVSRADIVAYESDLVERGYAASTISRRVSAVKGFHRFLVSDELVQTNPAESISLPQRPDRLPDALSVAQINALLDQPFGEGPRAQRDKAMLLIIAQGWASLAEQMEQMRAPSVAAEDDAGVSNEVAELAAALADDSARPAGAN